MATSTLGFQQVKVVAIAAQDLARAHQFYRDTLGLQPAQDGDEQGFYLGQTILMLKDDWYGAPTDMPNPRITLSTDNAPATEAALRAQGVVISDPVQAYGKFYVGGFLDSEGNKLWFCSTI